MKQIDFDRAFAQTPEEIHEGILAAFEKGEKHMKFRHKMISALSAAAVLIVVFAVIGFAGKQISTPKPDTLASPIQNTARSLELTEKTKTPSKQQDADVSNAATPEPALGSEPMNEEIEEVLVTPEPTPTPMAAYTPIPLAQEVTADTYGVYCTENGTCYHKNSTCSGMHNALFCSVKAAAEDGKLPCPVCCDFKIYVYANEAGEYYHAVEHCNGMMNATQHKISDGIMTEKPPCPDCIPETVYATLFGEYYHLDKECSGMKNAMQTYGYVAVQAGKLPCPFCVAK